MTNILVAKLEPDRIRDVNINTILTSIEEDSDEQYTLSNQDIADLDRGPIKDEVRKAAPIDPRPGEVGVYTFKGEDVDEIYVIAGDKISVIGPENLVKEYVPNLSHYDPQLQVL